MKGKKHEWRSSDCSIRLRNATNSNKRRAYVISLLLLIGMVLIHWEVVKNTSDIGSVFWDLDAPAVISGSRHTIEVLAYSPKCLLQQPKAGPNNSQQLKSWDDFAANSNLMPMQNACLASTNQIVNINEAHGTGLLHSGSWLAVIHDKKVLLLKRSHTLKTCPSTWSLVGEHANTAEDWQSTCQRGAREELQLNLVNASRFVNLLLDDNDREMNYSSVLVRTVYAETNRRDLQATGLFAVQVTAREVGQIVPDEEVVDLKWVPTSQLQYTKTACTPEILDLFRFVGERLVQKGF